MRIAGGIVLALVVAFSGCADSHGRGAREGIACGEATCPVADDSFCVHCVEGDAICGTYPEGGGPDWWTPAVECPGEDFGAMSRGVLYCDGPEDCASPEACRVESGGGSWASCRARCADCAPTRALCHDDDDCTGEPGTRCVPDADAPWSVCL